MPTIRYPGARVRVTATFTDPTNDDTLTDPTEVTFTVETPGEPDQVLVHGTDPEVEHDDDGVFHVDVDCPSPGRYDVRAEGAGALVAVDETSWTITPSRITPDE